MAVIGGAYALFKGVETFSAEQARKKAEQEAQKEELTQSFIQVAADVEQAHQKEIVDAQKLRTEAKTTARTARAGGGGGLLTGGETGLMDGERLGD